MARTGLKVELGFGDSVFAVLSLYVRFGERPRCFPPRQGDISLALECPCEHGAVSLPVKGGLGWVWSRQDGATGCQALNDCVARNHLPLMGLSVTRHCYTFTLANVWALGDFLSEMLLPLRTQPVTYYRYTFGRAKR